MDRVRAGRPSEEADLAAWRPSLPPTASGIVGSLKGTPYAAACRSTGLRGCLFPVVCRVQGFNAWIDKCVADSPQPGICLFPEGELGGVAVCVYTLHRGVGSCLMRPTDRPGYNMSGLTPVCWGAVLLVCPLNSCSMPPAAGHRSRLPHSLPLKRGMLHYAYSRKMPVQVSWAPGAACNLPA
jgi:hypothetical protein